MPPSIEITAAAVRWTNHHEWHYQVVLGMMAIVVFSEEIRMLTTANAHIMNCDVNSAADRIRALRELVLICYAQGQLDEPLQVTNGGDPFVGMVFAMFPQDNKAPELTANETAKIQRRIDDPVRLSHDEMLAAVKSAR